MPQERSAESWQGFVNPCLSHFPGLGGVFQQVPNTKVPGIGAYGPGPPTLFLVSMLVEIVNP
jgi:hypothetical protein